MTTSMAGVPPRFCRELRGVLLDTCECSGELQVASAVNK